MHGVGRQRAHRHIRACRRGGGAQRRAGRIARHYGVAVHTCVPADPQSKSGSEATVRIAKADLGPTDANLLDTYASFADLQATCEVFRDEVNHRAHRLTGRPPAEALVEERSRVRASGTSAKSRP